MELQSFVIGFVDVFEDVEDDACEAVLVKVDFLVVGDLADLAVNASVVVSTWIWKDVRT